MGLGLLLYFFVLLGRGYRGGRGCSEEPNKPLNPKSVDPSGLNGVSVQASLRGCKVVSGCRVRGLGGFLPFWGLGLRLGGAATLSWLLSHFLNSQP